MGGASEVSKTSGTVACGVSAAVLSFRGTVTSEQLLADKTTFASFVGAHLHPCKKRPVCVQTRMPTHRLNISVLAVIISSYISFRG